MFHGPVNVHNPQADALGRVALALAQRLERDWKREAVLRHVIRPAPMMVRWSSTGRPAASRDVVLGTTGGVGWRQFPLQGDASTLVKEFLDLPHRQLMLIGAAGSGKSVLAMLLTLGLIRRRDQDPRLPVPVLLPINAWDPREPVDRFVARRLGEDYRDILAPGGDPAMVAAALVDQDRVLPVLDGLDELPTTSHAAAVDALDRFAAEGRPVVVTCRDGEYEQAVTRAEKILSQAAVVELQPVSLDAAIAFLSFPEPAQPRWRPVFNHLQEHRDGALATTLSRPLMISLARTAYADPATTPDELLALPNRAAVAARLMDAFVTAIYDHPPTRHGGPRWRHYRPQQATRWLTCLAYHLYQAGTRDLRWWQMKPDLLATHPRRAAALAAAVAVTLTAVIAAVLGTRAAAAAMVFMCLTATSFFRPLWPHAYPPYLPRWYLTRREKRGLWIKLHLLFGFGCAELTAVVIGDVTFTIVAGGLVCTLANLRIPAWSPPPPALATPTQSMRHNRRIVAAAAVQHATIAAAGFAAATIATAGVAAAGFAAATGALHPLRAITTVAIAALVYAAAAAMNAGGTAWVRYRLIHARLVHARNLPVRLGRFLDDAHRRGVLRQAGPVYQFRHALIQDRLADVARTTVLRARVDAGDADAALWLAELLIEQDCVDEAVTVLRVRADAGSQGIAWWLAKVLAEQGRVEELRARADAGGVAAI